MADQSTVDMLEDEGRVVLRYLGNPNGSYRDIAGIANAAGVMPHPEHAVDALADIRFTQLCGSRNLPYTAIGDVRPDSSTLDLADGFAISLDELRAASTGTLPALLGRSLAGE